VRVRARPPRHRDFQISAVRPECVPSHGGRIEAISAALGGMARRPSPCRQHICAKTSTDCLLDVEAVRPRKNDGGGNGVLRPAMLQVRKRPRPLPHSAEFGKTIPSSGRPRLAFRACAVNLIESPADRSGITHQHDIADCHIPTHQQAPPSSLVRSASVALDHSAYLKQCLCQTATVNSLCQDPGLF